MDSAFFHLCKYINEAISLSKLMCKNAKLRSPSWPMDASNKNLIFLRHFQNAHISLRKKFRNLVRSIFFIEQSLENILIEKIGTLITNTN